MEFLISERIFIGLFVSSYVFSSSCLQSDPIGGIIDSVPVLRNIKELSQLWLTPQYSRLKISTGNFYWKSNQANSVFISGKGFPWHFQHVVSFAVRLKCIDPNQLNCKSDVVYPWFRCLIEYQHKLLRMQFFFKMMFKYPDNNLLC